MLQYVMPRVDLEDCIKIGKGRSAQNKQSKTQNRQYCKQRPPEMLDVQGVIGEWAYHRMMGLDVTHIKDTQCRNVMNDTFDVASSTLKIDVKTTIRGGVGIRVSLWKERNPADVYVLLWLNRQGVAEDAEFRPDKEEVVVQMQGWATRKMVFRYENIIRSSTAYFYLQPQHLLKSWDAVQSQIREDALSPEPASFF
jgi:hypothetical protein